MKLAWCFVVFALVFAVDTFSEATIVKKKLPYAVIIGSVSCEICSRDELPSRSNVIPGASVAVECKGEDPTASFRQEAKTDELGGFRVQLPLFVAKLIEICSVKLVSSTDPYCSVASTADPLTIQLESVKKGIYIYSAGTFAFKPEDPQTVCNQKQKVQDSRKLSEGQSSSMVNQFFLPPIPLLPMLPPLPQLPALPTLPPLLPVPGNANEAKLKTPSHSRKLQPESRTASELSTGSSQKAAKEEFPFLNPEKFLRPKPLTSKLPFLPPLLPLKPIIPPPLPPFSLPPFPDVSSSLASSPSPSPAQAPSFPFPVPRFPSPFRMSPSTSSRKVKTLHD